MGKKLDFYFVDNGYTDYLQEEEIKNYGNARVPNMRYPAPRKPKFICGPLFDGESGFSYYAPVSSYSMQKSANILIAVPGDRDPIKGSIRFNYMFPVPDEVLSRYLIFNIEDSSHRFLIKKEFQFLQDYSFNIKSFAKSIYEDIFEQKCTPRLLINSCRMRFLENRCHQYCKENGLELAEKERLGYSWKRDKVITIMEEGKFNAKICSDMGEI